MAELAGVLLNTVLARVRDLESLATPRDTARSLLSTAQRMVNAATDQVIATVSFATEPQRQIYPLAALVPACLRMQSVRYLGVDLDMLPYRQLAHYDRQWFRRVATVPLLWSPIGRDLLVIHPATVASVTVTLVYTTVTNDLVQDATPTDLPDQFLDAVADLTEMLLCVSRREFGAFAATAKRFAERLAINAVTDIATAITEPDNE